MRWPLMLFIGYQDRRRRRRVADATIGLLECLEPGLFAAAILLILYPLLLDPTLLASPAAHLWLARSGATAALSIFLGLHLLAVTALLPGQLLGAAVDAMAEAGPDSGPVAFLEPPDSRVCLVAGRHPWQSPAVTGQQAIARVRQQWRAQARRAGLPASFALSPSHHPRSLLNPTKTPAPSA